MRGLLLAIGALAAAGCDLDLDLDFHSEATSIRATGEADQTRVTICAGPSELLSCNAAEEFDVAVGDDTEPATEAFFGFGTLEAVFGPSPGGTRVTVIRTRDGATASALLPEPFELHGAAHGSRLDLSWQPTAGDAMSWVAELTCSDTVYGGDAHDIEDDGELSVSAGDLPDGEPGTCHGSITVIRRRKGEIDDVFPEGSRISATQERSFSFDVER